MENDIYSGKRVLVTGGTGMVGGALVELLRERGARIRVASLDTPKHLPEGIEYLKLDLTRWDACRQACRDMNYVFHLAGIKGGVGIGRSQAAHFFEVNALMSLHMLKAAREARAERYLFTSSIGVYPDAEVFRENKVWHTGPHKADWYGAWAKRMGELQCEAYLEQFNYKTCIVRPANIYGPYDNFDPTTATVVPALIARVCEGEDPLIVWGDGSQKRDFIYSKDCARGMMLAMEKHYECDPLNLGSGVGVSIKEVVEIICRYAPAPPQSPVGYKQTYRQQDPSHGHD